MVGIGHMGYAGPFTLSYGSLISGYSKVTVTGVTGVKPGDTLSIAPAAAATLPNGVSFSGQCSTAGSVIVTVTAPGTLGLAAGTIAVNMSWTGP